MTIEELTNLRKEIESGPNNEDSLRSAVEAAGLQVSYCCEDCDGAYDRAFILQTIDREMNKPEGSMS